jgi:hypothetical protein
MHTKMSRKRRLETAGSDFSASLIAIALTVRERFTDY